jgi:hypothetical protein
MPISLTPDPARRLLVATAVGAITREELQDFVRTARPGDLRAWPLLFDTTEATTNMTSGQVGGVASTRDRRFPVQQVAEQGERSTA